MKLKSIFFLAFGLIFFSSCEKEDIIPPAEKGEFANGIFVLNEGNYGSGNASVTFVDPKLENATNNIYSSSNGGELLGDTAQDLAFYEEKVFIILNVSNTIEVIDRNTFTSLGIIDKGLNNPRKIAFKNETAYVTNWGDPANPDDDYVALYNVERLSGGYHYSVPEGPEDIIIENGKVYVAHTGGHSFNNKITVIDGSDQQTVQVGDVPNSMVVDNGFLWVLSGGKPFYADVETAGKISKIDLNTLETVEEYEFQNATMHPANLVIEGDKLYYTIGNKVYAFEKGAASLPEQELFSTEEVTSLYGFAVKDNKVFIASTTPDFTGNGTLYVYDATTGELLNELETGINPNGIFFN
jgi:hypothetical protein